MYQSWGSLLFIHWQIDASKLRPLIPPPLEVDTFDGTAWVAIAPFTMWDVRPRFVPSIPLLSSFHELNVRTYVKLDGEPGVWFFSLDANQNLAVKGARALYHLPYHYSDIELTRTNHGVDYHLRRPGELPAYFDARWSEGDDVSHASPGSLEFFLVERYCLFTEHRQAIYRCPISHAPWPLRSAALEECSTNLLAANGIEQPAAEPHLLAAGPVKVDVGWLRKVA